MRSTMPDFPLTLQHFLWRSTTLFPRKEIVTRREAGRHRYTYADFGKRVAQLAHALKDLGIGPGDRVGTLAWNTYRHLEPLFSYEELIAGRPTEYAWPELDEQDAAAMCYTSGTTGRPKGVVYSHRSSVLHAFGITVGGIGPTEGDTLLPIVPMFHANAWGHPFAATMLGAKQVFPDRFLDPVSLTELIHEEGVTFSAGVPSVWIALLQYLDKTGTNLDGFRMFVGGSAMPAALYDGLSKHGIDVIQGWGMTETSPVAACTTMKSYMTEKDKRAVRLKQGLPIAGVELRLANVESGELVPWDGKSSGEIQVRGPWVTTSYYRGVDPDRFTADGWLRTGDVANVDGEGYAQIVDRTKDLIKSGGEWISSVELESAIMGHPKVLEAAVIGVPHPKWQERPVAYVVPKPDFKGAVSQAEILEYLTPLVAKWWLPDEVRFVDEIPKTSVGKFDKKVIRQWASSSAPVTAPSE
ncbi:MAG: long-chain fatty acid--CoA ligase [Chloroflexi bacterium]|nr:MAG: long-chain fatty acid--CoA ligase [Chloroflexota bacterium]